MKQRNEIEREETDKRVRVSKRETRERFRERA